VFVVTSPKIWKLHGAKLDLIQASASRWNLLHVPDGESAKTLRVVSSLWERMIELRGHRDSRVVAFGGGTVGDVAGFVASCFLRGIEFAQIPSTLLAQVDAAIGGKTGINLPDAKNSVGQFHHPKAVICDVDLLSSLSTRQLRSGLVEAIKIAAFFDLELLAEIEENLDKLLAGDSETLVPVVAGAAQLKAKVVEVDVAEKSTRMLLNFGHTLAHALEASLDFDETSKGELSHGEAVAYGMLFALRFARQRGLSSVEAARLRGLIERLSVPQLPQIEVDRVIGLMRGDKKSRESCRAWVLPSRLGQGTIVNDIRETEVRTELEKFVQDPWAE
jgi:3-dehydroquinate synthase